MEKLLKNKKIDLIASAVLIVLAIIFLISLLSRHETGSSSASSFTEGREYMDSLAAQDVEAIDTAIFNSRRDKMIDEINEKMAEDPDYVWKALADINTVMIGDSRVGVFESGGFMDSSRVIWEAATAMEEVVDFGRIQAANPNLVVIAFGLNDIGLIHMTPEDFAAGACLIVDQIQAMLPNAYIYIQSTLPPSPYGSKTTFTYELVTEWSDREIAYYKEHGYRYLDINFLIWDHMELYAEDGFHFQPAFYPYWAAEVLKQYIYDSAGETGETDPV